MFGQNSHSQSQDRKVSNQEGGGPWSLVRWEGRPSGALDLLSGRKEDALNSLHEKRNLSTTGRFSRLAFSPVEKKEPKSQHMKLS